MMDTTSPPVIYGCGNLGLEVLSYLLETGSADAVWRPVFIDPAEGRLGDAERVAGRECTQVPDLGDIAPGTPFVVALGDPSRRDLAYADCIEHGLVPVRLVHPTARVDRAATLGEGVVVAPFCYVGPLARVDANALLNTHVSVGHDACVGRSAVLSPLASLAGFAGVGRCGFLGTHAAVLPRRRLGAYSKLAAGAVLDADTEDGALAVGNPARHRVMFRLPESAQGVPPRVR